jgi:hypothetical protein
VSAVPLLLLRPGQYRKGSLQLEPGCNLEQTLEANVTGVLNGIREAAGKVRRVAGRHSALVTELHHATGFSCGVVCLQQYVCGCHRSGTVLAALHCLHAVRMPACSCACDPCYACVRSLLWYCTCSRWTKTAR